MARALLTAFAIAPAAAEAQFNETALPEEMFGIQARLGAGALAGDGAGDVDQPPMAHASASLQVRLLPEWYVELTTFGERTLKAEAPEGKTILGLEGATAGIRWRAGVSPASRVVLGMGGGGGRVFVQGRGVPGKGESWSAGAAYVVAGFEREVSSESGSAGTVGLELIGQHYFVREEDAPFRGTGITARVTFGYYMSGGYCGDLY